MFVLEEADLEGTGREGGRGASPYVPGKMGSGARPSEIVGAEAVRQSIVVSTRSVGFTSVVRSIVSHARNDGMW